MAAANFIEIRNSGSSIGNVNGARHGQINQDNATLNLHQERGYTPLTYLPSMYPHPRVPLEPTDFGARSGYFLDSKTTPSQGLFNFLTTTLVLAGLIGKFAYSGSSHRKRRQAATLGDLMLEDSGAFFKVLNDLDQEDCIAKAVCTASSIESPEKERNEKLLLALGIAKNVPVPWKDLTDQKTKYQYAAFVGSTLNQTQVEEGCSGAFARCRLPPEDVLRMLTNEVNSCEAMMNTLQSLLPKEDRQEKENI